MSPEEAPRTEHAQAVYLYPHRNDKLCLNRLEKNMAQTVAKMTKEELKEIEPAVETALEQKLLEIIGDPDEGLEIRKAIRNRLLRQQQAVAAGERGRPLEEVVQQIGLE